MSHNLFAEKIHLSHSLLAQNKVANPEVLNI